MKSNSCNCYEWLMPILFHSQAKYQYYPSPSTSRRVPHVTPTFVTPYPTKNKHPCQLLIPHDASPDCFSPMRIHHLKKKNCKNPSGQMHKSSAFLDDERFAAGAAGSDAIGASGADAIGAAGDAGAGVAGCTPETVAPESGVDGSLSKPGQDCKRSQ